MADLLLVVVGDASPQTIRLALAGAPERVRVVAPAVVGAIDWLANADEAARDRAVRRAREAERALDGLVEVTSEAGDVDPVQAVADALVNFPATGIALAGAAADLDLERELRGFGLPVTRVGPPPARRTRLNRDLRKLARGRDADAGTLLAFIVGMNVALLIGAIVLSLLAILVLWIVGVY